jgi:ribosomal-protein-alanine N-acetyltransferase
MLEAMEQDPELVDAPGPERRSCGRHAAGLMRGDKPPRVRQGCSVAIDFEVDPTTFQVVRFTTPRLQGVRLKQSDAAALRRLHADPEVMAMIGGVRSPDASDAWLTRNLAHWDREGFGQWMLHTAEGPIGRGGLRRIDPCVGEDLVEVGYVLAQQAWGHGFATEATLMFVELARSQYGLDQLGAVTLEGNASSVGVLQKCGFTFERSVDHDLGPHRFHRLRL